MAICLPKEEGVIKKKKHHKQLLALVRASELNGAAKKHFHCPTDRQFDASPAHLSFIIIVVVNVIIYCMHVNQKRTERGIKNNTHYVSRKNVIVAEEASS